MKQGSWGAGAQCLIQCGAGTGVGRGRPQVPLSEQRSDTCFGQLGRRNEMGFPHTHHREGSDGGGCRPRAMRRPRQRQEALASLGYGLLLQPLGPMEGAVENEGQGNVSDRAT